MYGLKISADDGLKEPLFGDATLVGMDAANELFGAAMNPDGAKYLTQPLIPLVPEAALPPREYLLEVAPDSFIAVRREKEVDAIRRAAEIRALLTATLVLRGGVLGAFSDRPSSLAWSFGHTSIERDKMGQLRSDKEIRINEHVMLAPLMLAKSEIRASYEGGIPLGPVPKASAPWDIHRLHPVSRLFADHSISSKWADRLRGIGCHLTDACCAATYEHQLLMAITCLEGIFCAGGNHEKKLLPRLEAYPVQSADQSLAVKKILDARNKYVHQGEPLKEPAKYARFALGLAWAFLDIAALFVTHRPKQEQWELHLDMLSQHRSLMAMVAENYSKDDAIAMGAQMVELTSKFIRGRLTVQRD